MQLWVLRCPLYAAKFWLVLFESLYEKKSFKLLFRQTGNWNSQIYLLREKFIMLSWTDIWSNFHWRKYFAIVGTLFVEPVVKGGLLFPLPRYSPLNCPIQNTPPANMLLQYLLFHLCKGFWQSQTGPKTIFQSNSLLWDPF